jgi:hypothetical protein
VVGTVGTVGTLVDGVVTGGSSFSPQPDAARAAAIAAAATAGGTSRLLEWMPDTG